MILFTYLNINMNMNIYIYRNTDYLLEIYLFIDIVLIN